VRKFALPLYIPQKILKEENRMNRKLFYVLGVLVLVASMVLSARHH
jgi:hypothetical protein